MKMIPRPSNYYFAALFARIVRIVGDFFFLAPRGTSGERTEERGFSKNLLSPVRTQINSTARGALSSIPNGGEGVRLQLPRAVFLPIVFLVFLSHLSPAQDSKFELRDGGIIRGPKDKKQIALEFTGDSFAEGGTTILDELAKRKAKASFFFTGNFLRRAEFKPLIERIIKEGHYIGPHSDKHLLYCPWDGTKKTLITKEVFTADVEKNLQAIEKFGLKRSQITHWIPPFEHYNAEITAWSTELGLKLINFTPGTRSAADYTGEADKNFVSSQTIYDSIVKKEKDDPKGLNGFLLIMHIGAGPRRTDKFHDRLGGLLDYLQGKGYEFIRVDELLKTP